MARKKFLEENNDEEQENLLKAQHQHQQQQLQHQPHQHLNLNKNLLTTSSSSGGHANINPHLHIPQHGLGHGIGHKTNKHRNAMPKSSEESYFSVLKQLSMTGLTIREMPGDGNCLFRALADQLEGHPRNHLDHRRAVVQYMRDNRSDFEPFVEDDEPFERYIQTLAQVGTFAGNDAIVAFARLHNVIVVIHQLDSPAWLIHPSSEENYPSNGREVHIAYHNGDHYNSVRKIGDVSDAPSNIKLGLQGPAAKSAHSSASKLSPPHGSSTHKTASSTVTRHNGDGGDGATTNYDSVFFGRRDEDYWVKDAADIARLVEEVMQQTDYPDPNFVRDTLIEFNFDMVSTVDFILSMSIIMSQPPERPPPPTEQEAQSATSASVVGQGGSESEANVVLDMDKPHDSASPTVSSPVTNELQLQQCMPSPANANPINTILINTDPVELDGGRANESASATGSAATISEVTELDEIQPTTILSQNETKFTARETKAKLSTRQKKDLKKRERKRESEKRKKAESENTVPKTGSPTTLLATSTFGALNI